MQITINKVPIITCIPCIPVVEKKIAPNTESEIEKVAIQYSTPCNKVKITPNEIVIIKALKVS